MNIAETLGQPKPVPTPCIDVCTMDEAAGLCLGCARTADEIAAWQAADAGFKRAVWDRLPERRGLMKMGAYRLPWSAEECAAFTEDMLRSGCGRWRLGIHGAEAIFSIDPGAKADIASSAEAITAITSRGALRLLKHEKTIAIAFSGETAPALLRRPGRTKAGPASTLMSACALPGGEASGARLDGRGDGGSDGPQAISFVLPRGRVKLQKSETVRLLGPDTGAILEQHRRAWLYDTGLGKDLAARICLRTADPLLITRLDAAEGSQFSDLERDWEPRARRPGSRASGCPGSHAEPSHVTPDNACGVSGVTLTAERCDRAFDLVVETGLGRVELFAPIEQPRLHLERLAPPRELPLGWELRPVFALGALFYPERA